MNDNYIQQIAQIDQYETCSYCLQRISPIEMDEQKYTMLQTTDCFHLLHRDCFNLMAYDSLRQYQPLKCPKCNAEVAEREVRDTMTEQQFEEWQKFAQLQLLSQNQNLVSCSCGNIMEVVQGEIERNQKDENGKVIDMQEYLKIKRHLNRQSSVHMRIKCQSEPYHLGKTCEQFKEFKEQSKCRFCNDKLTQPPPSMLPAFKEVCRSAACIELMGKSCEKVLDCGHHCCGFKDEEHCMPCLNPECVKENEALTFGNNCDSYCIVCYTEGLGAQPSVQLECKHIFHLDCLHNKVKQKWANQRITFSFMECPACQKEIKAPNCQLIENEMVEARIIHSQVVSKAIERAKHEGIDKDPRLKIVGNPLFNNLQELALQKLSFYQCFQCKHPYYGGMNACDNIGEQNNNGDQAGFKVKPEDLICGSCSALKLGAGVTDCKKHGKDFIEFKCRYCCTVALWFCFGTTHFCEPCHQVANDSRKKECLLYFFNLCPGIEQCPLKIDHPPTGTEYALGCGLCRNNAEHEPLGIPQQQRQPIGNKVRGGLRYLFGKMARKNAR